MIRKKLMYGLSYWTVCETGEKNVKTVNRTTNNVYIYRHSERQSDCIKTDMFRFEIRTDL
jgi:hypothetical protein